MALPDIKQTATDARLDAVSVPGGASWATAAREAAMARVRKMGLPDRRDEYWKFTRPDTLISPAPSEAALFDPSEKPVFGDMDRLCIVFVDGVFDPEASDDLSLEGVSIERLADVSQADIHWAKDLYGVLETRGQDPVERPLAALNTAIASDGVVLHVTGRVSKPINFVYHHKALTSDATLHHLIKLDPGADITILETGPAAARFNKSMEVDVADGAGFHHVRTQGRDHERRAVTHIFARLGEKSAF